MSGARGLTPEEELYMLRFSEKGMPKLQLGAFEAMDLQTHDLPWILESKLTILDIYRYMQQVENSYLKSSTQAMSDITMVVWPQARWELDNRLTSLK